jgi:hypothetical protein
MHTHLTAAMAPVALSTQGLVTYLQGLFGPLFLGIVGIVAIFFLFTREITRFVQFIAMPWPLRSSSTRPASCTLVSAAWRTRSESTDPESGRRGAPLVDLPTYSNIWRIEKRLYKLYDFRLPAPLPITWIGVFAGITVPYVFFLIAVGLPFNHNLVWLYVLPPGVLTWLTTRPVIESKRLPELVSSQLRYVSEPRSWRRMTPSAEKGWVLATGLGWQPDKGDQKVLISDRAWPSLADPRQTAALGCTKNAGQTTTILTTSAFSPWRELWVAMLECAYRKKETLIMQM